MNFVVYLISCSYLRSKKLTLTMAFVGAGERLKAEVGPGGMGSGSRTGVLG